MTWIALGCNSSFFYIKPQQKGGAIKNDNVVIHPFSTSNHNILGFVWGFLGGCNSSFFYIKPQQSAISAAPPSRCNSSFFYIKPQRQADDWRDQPVVIHPFSTSNHNGAFSRTDILPVVIHPFSTSNHNADMPVLCSGFVVIHPFSTSNHNENALFRDWGRVVIHPFSTSNHNRKTELKLS